MKNHKEKDHTIKVPQFKCDQCEWKAGSAHKIDQHQKYIHSKEKINPEKHNEENAINDDIEEMSEEPNTEEINPLPDSENIQIKDLELEITNLRKELKFMKNRFEQVLDSHNDVEKDMEEMKKTYEEELAKVREDFVKVKAEKEHFRVRNELLHNMSKIIVDKCLKGNESNHTNPDDTEEIDCSTFISNKYQR